jgi:zinc transporter ZupT
VSRIEIINAIPVWALATIVVGVAVIFSVGLQLLARWRFGVDRLIVNHEVAGFKYAVVSVAYAVLLAFVVVGVWGEFVRTEHSVGAEAERFYNLHRNSYNFPEETGRKMRQALIAYAIAVRDDDWPMMERGLRGSKSASEAYTRLSLAVGQAKPENIGLLPSSTHAINLMQQIADLRLGRLADVGGPMTPTIWGVLLLGAIVTLAYPVFFATKDVAPQVLMTAGLAAVVGAILFLTINLNFPFTGPSRLTAKPIDNVIQRMLAENRANAARH